MHRLRTLLQRLSHTGYTHYRDIKGVFHFPTFEFEFNAVQADPFAPPSHITIRRNLELTGFPAEMFSDRKQSIAFRDALARVIVKNIRKLTQGHRGTGNSGVFAIHSGGQEILDRNSVHIRDGKLEVRLLAGLPAYGRKIAGDQALEMLTEELPLLIEESLTWNKLDKRYFESFVNLYGKQEWLREQVRKLGAVAFVANGSKLARASGINQAVLENSVPFWSPASLEKTFNFPDGKSITGMLIPGGVTLITGGGFHGKSTLLSALQDGIYNHIPGDGREYVISDRATVKIRAEEGRAVTGVDLSPFIQDLPGGLDTHFFSTKNASGSTSQAANILESLEAGARVLLIDEDTSATNFLIRDRRMQKLVEKEPITPYIDAVCFLYEQHGISTVMVSGGSGDYLDVADRVILMDAYRASDVTAKAKDLCTKFPISHHREFKVEIQKPHRIFDPTSFSAAKGKKHKSISVHEKKLIFGREIIDLSLWEQLRDSTQIETIGEILHTLQKNKVIDGRRTLFWILEEVQKRFDKFGLEWICSNQNWTYTCEIRPIEFVVALNRLRTVVLKQRENKD